MIGPAGTISKIGISTMLDDLNAEQIEFIAQVILAVKYGKEVRVEWVRDARALREHTPGS